MNFQNGAYRLIKEIVELEEKKIVLSLKVAEARIKRDRKERRNSNPRTSQRNKNLKSTLTDILRNKDKDVTL